MIEPNALIDRRFELEGMTEIPDMQKYADEWRKLAADFDTLGFFNNAGMCWSKAAHYSRMSGEYVRKFEEVNFVELVPVLSPAHGQREMSE